jgi:hypothetical protein
VTGGRALDLTAIHDRTGSWRKIASRLVEDVAMRFLTAGTSPTS